MNTYEIKMRWQSAVQVIVALEDRVAMCEREINDCSKLIADGCDLAERKANWEARRDDTALALKAFREEFGIAI